MLPTHNFNLFELDFDIKFPLLYLLLFLSDLKSTSVLLCHRIGITHENKLFQHFPLPNQLKTAGFCVHIYVIY